MGQCGAEVHVGVVSANPGPWPLLKSMIDSFGSSSQDARGVGKMGGTEIGLTRHRRLAEPRCCRHVLVCCRGRENVVVFRPVWEIQ